MAVAPGSRASRLATCVATAGFYHLSGAQARAAIDHQLDVITASWDDAADAARLTRAQRTELWGRQILDPFALEGY